MRSERGQTLVEYAMILVLVVVVGLVALRAIGRAVAGNQVQTCRQLACPDGRANPGRSCDDPPVVCTP